MDMKDNRFLVDLKCGYDMPMDTAHNLAVLPSIYCECSYSAIPKTALNG